MTHAVNNNMSKKHVGSKLSLFSSFVLPISCPNSRSSSALPISAERIAMLIQLYKPSHGSSPLCDNIWLYGALSAYTSPASADDVSLPAHLASFPKLALANSPALLFKKQRYDFMVFLSSSGIQMWIEGNF